MRSIFFLLSLLGCAIASAETSRWSDFFDGDESMVAADVIRTGRDSIDPSFRPLPLKEMIRDRRNCVSQIDHIFESVEAYRITYQQAIKSGSQQESSRIFQELQQYLPKVPVQCLAAAHRAYLISTLNLIDDRYWANKNNLLIFGLFIANQDLVSLLTPESRSQLARGKESIWTRKQGGDYLLSGLYSCENGKIYLSSSLAPYDLASALMHELNHFYADKIGNQYFGTFGSRELKRPDVESLLVSEELYASLGSAYYQARRFKGEKGPVARGADLSFFEPHGLLAKIIENRALVFGSFREFIHSVHVVETWRRNQELSAMVCSMDKKIREGYFGPSKDSCNLSYLYEPKNRVSLELYLEDEFAPLRKYAENMPRLLGELRRITEALKEPSRPCRRFMEAKSNGQLGNYLGTQLTDGPVRPGNAGIKPCLKIPL